MRILMISCPFPYPPTRGGTEVRTFYLLKYLSQRHEVTLVTQRAAHVTDGEVAQLRQWVAQLVVFPRPAAVEPGGLIGKASRLGQFLAEGIPPSVRFLHSPEMQAWLDRQVQSQAFDALTCEHSVNEIFVRPEWQARIPRRVVDIHSSVYGSCRDQLATGASPHAWRDRINLPLLRRYEQRYCRKFSDLVVTTDIDQQQMQRLSPQTPVHVIPNGVELDQFPFRPQDQEGRRLIFAGAMDYQANIDAARFLSQEVFPQVRQRYPDATLTLVGARPTSAVEALGQLPGVTVTGRVPAMIDYLHQASVCVVPMRTGYGIKNKSLEALAAGVPLVASDRGLEGLRVDGPGAPLAALRANRPEEYVAAISRLWEQPDLRRTLARNGRALIEAHFSWERAGQAYERVLTGTTR